MTRPMATPSGAFTPYASPPMSPEIRTTPKSMIGSATRTFRARPLAPQDPRRERDDDDLEVAHHRGEAGPDVVHDVVERQQVRREEDAGDRRQADRPGAHRPELAPLDPGGEGQQRQPVQAAEHDAGRRADLRPAVEDAREGDAEGPGQGREPRMPGDRVKRVHASRLPARSLRPMSVSHRWPGRRPDAGRRRSAGRAPRTGPARAATAPRASGRCRTASSGRP